MHVRLSAGAGKDLNFRCHRVKEIGDAIGSLIDGQPHHKLRVLGRYAYGAASRVAVMAVIGLCPELVIVLNVKRLVAVEGNQSRGADVNGIRSERQSL